MFSFSAALKRPLKTLLKRAWKAHFATLKTCQEELIKLAEVCCSRPQNVDFTIWKCDSWNWLTLLKRYKMEAWKGPIWTPQEGHATLIKMASRGCGKVISEVRFGPFCRGASRDQKLVSAPPECGKTQHLESIILYNLRQFHIFIGKVGPSAVFYRSAVLQKRNFSGPRASQDKVQLEAKKEALGREVKGGPEGSSSGQH